MNRHLRLIIIIAFFFLICTGAVADGPIGQYYLLENVYVSPHMAR